MHDGKILASVSRDGHHSGHGSILGRRRDLPAFDVRPRLPLERARLVTLLRDLPAPSWHRPTVNANWDVGDVVLHLIGNDIGRLGPSLERNHAVTSSFDQVANLIEASNERWVSAARRIGPALAVDLLEFLDTKVNAAFDLVDLEAAGVPVAWTGDGPSPYWLGIAREYSERWVHQAQIRSAIGAPAIDDHEYMHPVLAAFMRCLPRAYEPIRSVIGTSVRVGVIGAAGGTWTVRRGRSRWHLVAGADSPTALRLLSRSGPVDQLAQRMVVEGDTRLGLAAANAVAIMTTKI